MRTMINFYSKKGNLLARRIYRNFVDSITLSDNESKETYEKWLNEFTVTVKSPDWIKMAWCVPSSLLATLPPQKALALKTFTENKHKKIPKKVIKNVYPHSADEFSLDQDFLNFSFNSNSLPNFSKDDTVFTVGSCFARNFATFLETKDINVAHFSQSEDLNSPGSNSSLLKYASSIDTHETKQEVLDEIIKFWGSHLNNDQLEKHFVKIVQRLIAVNRNVAAATKIIVTLGNIIDFYWTDSNGNQKLMPKFLALDSNEDLEKRTSLVSILKKTGGDIHLSNFKQTKEHISIIYESLRVMNKNADIIFTVSPVPLDNVIGLSKNSERAIEIDCISKSTIRAALHEAIFNFNSPKDRAFYLPSFEIVRWIAPTTGMKIFGAEDASSRHVSNDILNTIMDFVYSETKPCSEKSQSTTSFNPSIF